MPEFRYVSDREAAEKHRARSSALPRARPEIAKAPKSRNIETVLALGDTRYFSFRRRVYGIPPLPFKAGHRLLDTYTRTLASGKFLAEQGDKSMAATYFDGLDALKKLLWRHSFPSGKGWRLARRFGLLRNPYRMATEQEVLEMTDFFLQGRMKSNVQYSLASPADLR